MPSLQGVVLQDFQGTMELVRRYKFPSLFINQFYPRPGTPAARMKRIPTQIVRIINSLSNQDTLINRTPFCLHICHVGVLSKAPYQDTSLIRTLFSWPIDIQITGNTVERLIYKGH